MTDQVKKPRSAPRREPLRRWRGVTAQQAILTLVIAGVLSVLAGVVEMVIDARQLRVETQEQTERLLSLVNGSAAEAAFQLNTDLAEQLVSGLFSNGNVERVTIVDDFGRVMANQETSPDPSAATNWLLQQVFGDILFYRQELAYDLGNQALPQVVGEIELVLAADAIGQSFIDRVQLIFLLSVVKALAIAVLVVLGFHFLITRPLLRVHDALLHIDPMHPGAWPKPDLARHRHDELGNIVTGLDDLLLAFQKGLDQRDQLQEISSIDGLTGIANRREFDAVLASQWASVERRGSHISLIFMDIDYFKPFNDNYGHIEGDQCLQQVAAAVASTASRKSDLVARYGGEEFVVLMPDTDLHGAQDLAAKIQESVWALDIRHEFSEASDRISLSIGLVSLIPRPDMTCSDLLELADQRLYQAKSSGRNQIVCSDAPD